MTWQAFGGFGYRTCWRWQLVCMHLAWREA